MITSKIAAVCKKYKSMLIYNQGASQWIGTPAAIYPLFKFPRVDEESLCAIFDIDGKKREQMTIRTTEHLPIDLADHSDSEIPLKEHTASSGIISIGESRAFFDGSKLIFAKTAYLTPLRDIDDVTYYLRSSGGREYIVAKYGMMVIAGIMPVKIDYRDLINDTEDYLRLLRLSLDNEEG